MQFAAAPHAHCLSGTDSDAHRLTLLGFAFFSKKRQSHEHQKPSTWRQQGLLLLLLSFDHGFVELEDTDQADNADDTNDTTHSCTGAARTTWDIKRRVPSPRTEKKNREKLYPNIYLQ